MGKVIMLGAGPLQVEAIKIAKELGFYVICADYDPDAVGFEFADQAEVISTLDTEAVLALAKREAVDFVITSTSDAPVRTAAYVAEKLGLPFGISYENAICATYKDAMRERMKKFGIPMPQYRICSSFEAFESALEDFRRVCIVKPADSAASRGVKLLNDPDDRINTRSFYEDELSFSNKGILMVEEYVSGAEVSVEAITVGGSTSILAITDKMVTEPPYFVELGHFEQSCLDEKTKKQICDLVENVVAAIGICDGPSHTEIKVTKTGLSVIETAARLGGDFITSKLVPLATGVDMVRESVRLALGRPHNFRPKWDRGSAIRFITSGTGSIASISIDDRVRSIPGFIEIDLYKSLGDTIFSPRSSNDRIGHIVCDGCCSEDAIEASNAILAAISIELA